MPEKKTEVKPKPLAALDAKIEADAYATARREIDELEQYLAKWSQDHAAGYNNHGFWGNPSRSYDPNFTTPHELYQTDTTKGWKGFRENFIKERAKQLATETAEALLAKIKLIP